MDTNIDICDEVNNKTVSIIPIAKWEKFQHRLISLAVAIDDKNKTIDLLLDAIKTHQQESDVQIQEENTKLRVEYNAVSNKLKQSIQASLDSYSNATQKKKDITDEIELLAQKARKENEITKSRLLQAQQTIKHQTQDAHDEWQSCKHNREELWIANKVKHVKACTVDALQPELKRLSLSQEMEMNKIIEEAQTKRRYLEKQMDIDFKRGLNLYIDNIEVKKAQLVQACINKWSNLIRDLKGDHNKEVKDVKERVFEDMNQNSICLNLNAIGINISDESNKLKCELQRKLEDIQATEKSRRLTMKDRSEHLLGDIQGQLNKDKENWMKSERQKYLKWIENEMIDVHILCRKERDLEIDLLIRSNYKRKTELESEIASKLKTEMISETSRLKEEKLLITTKNADFKEHLSKVTEDLDRLCIDKSNFIERIEMKKHIISKFEANLLILKQSQDNMSSTSNTLSNEVYKINQDHKIRKLLLQNKLNELKNQSKNNEW